MLDPHYGDIKTYQALVDEIHARGMYVMVDFTVGTMADLIGFDGYVVPKSLYVDIFTHALRTSAVTSRPRPRSR